MGTTLTGTTPQDTYDSLIKVTDNGPLSGSLKTLTDGLGNDSALALSTGGASITGTLAVSGNATFDTNTLFVDASANEVGVGTASPAYKFNVVTNEILGRQNLAAIDRTAQNFVTFTNPAYSVDASMGLMLRVFPQSDARQGAGILASGGSQNGETDLNLFVSTGIASSTSYSALTLKGGSGNVGIGTSSPAQKLEVAGKIRATDDVQLWSANPTLVWESGRLRFYNNATATEVVNITSDNYLRLLSGTGGIQFNGDTAAANALDDYEEGTFTATLKGSVSDPTTPVTTTGTYTKIGRQVTLRGEFVNVNTSGASGDVSITGVPFLSSSQNTGSVMIFNFDLNTSTAQNSYIGASVNYLEFYGQKNNAGWVTLRHNAGAGRYLIFNITYFV